ncbi:MAG TPA: 4Fe-4S binding protein [Verrucomicrobia bacterium]|nr:4Fe-4S binding protein [Verrucomicrobiota bacterium]
MRSGYTCLIVSIITRLMVVLLLCYLAFMTEYLNFKLAHNNARLVELSAGKPMRIFYEQTEKFFSMFGDPLETAQKNGGMTWSIRIMGVPFTDPVSAISVLAKNHRMEIGFVLGLIGPLALALVFGRVFCSYICSASLLFFSISRLRRLLLKWFYFPEWSLNRGFAWGVLIGGTLVCLAFGHGIWSLLLPYFAVGQTVFHGLAFGTLSVSFFSIVVFSIADLLLGKQFTCRYLCPTGRLLGWIGRRSLVSIRREAPRCLENCNACADICPMRIKPNQDESVDCSLCGECMIVCPTKCLSIAPIIGKRKVTAGSLK